MEVDATTRPEPMTDSVMDNVIEILSSPVATPMKRKVEEGVQREGKENGNKDKKAKVEAATVASLAVKPLVELKGRKLVYKEEAAPWSLPRRRTLQFETDLLEASEGGKPWAEIPSEYHDLIAMAGHEHAAATEAALMKAIKTALCGASDPKKPDPIATSILAPLVSQLFSQQHYGLLPTDFPSTSSATNNVKIPASLQIRRWEVKEPEKYFSPENLEAVRARKTERERVRAECVRILRDMDDIEARELVKGDKEDKKGKREEVKIADQDIAEQSPRVSVARTSREGTAATNDSRRSASPVKKSKLTPEEEEARRVKREEREARQAEKAEKKAARDLELQKKEEEKAKLEAVKAKQANMFGSFFKAKPKPAEKAAPVATKAREASPEMSEYDQVFKPYLVRPGTRWAATNQWTTSMHTSQASSSTDGWTAADFLRDHMSRHNRKLANPRTKLPPGLKSGSSHPTVGEVWLAHQEAADPRKVLGQLRKNHKYPWKFLAFDRQARPPYSGTFTKKSASVGPRTPFAQDPVFDYTYDSGDDWEEDEGGEDVDDFGEAKPDEEEDAEDEDEEEDDEFADFFDDSEDAGYAPMPVDNDDDDPFLHAGPSSRQERLPINPIKKADKPRKIVKVTPWFRGPIWEEQIGKSTELSEYSLQLLNDTPDSFDPFTYLSNEPTQSFKPNMSTVSIGLGTVPCMIGTTSVLAPAVPTSTVAADTPTGSDGTPVAASKSRAVGPKIAFPATHLNELYTLIHGNSKIQTDLVSQLRQHFESVTSKAAIEAKIKEVAFREGKTKDSKWKVKAEAWTAAGLEPPPVETAPAPPSIFAHQPTA